MLISRLGTVALVAGALSLAGRAQAVSTLYQFTSGQATITVTTGATTLTPLAPPVLTLNGIFAEFNDVGPALNDFEFTTSPNQAITLVAAYGGYDQIVVNSASLTPGVGYTHYGASVVIPGQQYAVSVAPVHVDAVYSAAYSAGPPPPPASNIPLSFDNVTPLVATIDIIAGTFTLQGITLGVLVIPGEAYPLIVKADLSFQGIVPVSTPEPGVLALVGVGLGFLAARRLRRV